MGVDAWPITRVGAAGAVAAAGVTEGGTVGPAALGLVMTSPSPSASLESPSQLASSRATDANMLATVSVGVGC